MKHEANECYVVYKNENYAFKQNTHKISTNTNILNIRLNIVVDICYS